MLPNLSKCGRRFNHQKKNSRYKIFHCIIIFYYFSFSCIRFKVSSCHDGIGINRHDHFIVRKFTNNLYLLITLKVLIWKFIHYRCQEILNLSACAPSCFHGKLLDCVIGHDSLPALQIRLQAWIFVSFLKGPLMMWSWKFHRRCLEEKHLVLLI